MSQIMITQQFLQSCTDEQINKGVAWAACAELSIRGLYSWTSRLLSNPPNYCTNPNDIMPIAFANKFSIWPTAGYTDTYRVSDFSGFNYRFNKNPLRAICEVYILMEANK